MSSDNHNPSTLEKQEQIDVFLSRCHEDIDDGPGEDVDISIHPPPVDYDDATPQLLTNEGGEEDDDISMPTGNMSGISPQEDDNDDTSSNQTVVPADAFDEPDLIDLGPFIIPTDVHVIMQQKLKIERDFERAAGGQSVSDRLTGDSSRSASSNHDGSDEFKECPPLLSLAHRPPALTLKARQMSEPTRINTTQDNDLIMDRPPLLSSEERPHVIASAPAQNTRQVSGSSRLTAFSFSPAKSGRQISGSSGITAAAQYGTPRSTSAPTRNTTPTPLVYYIEEEDEDDDEIDLPESVPSYVFVLSEGAAHVKVTPSVPVLLPEVAWNLQSVNRRRRRRLAIVGVTVACIIIAALITIIVGIFGRQDAVSMSNQSNTKFPPFDERNPPDEGAPSSPDEDEEEDDDTLFTQPTPVAPTPTSVVLPPIPVVIDPREDLPTLNPAMPRPTRPPRARRTRSPTEAPASPPPSTVSSEPPSVELEDNDDPHSPVVISNKEQFVIETIVAASPQSLAALLDVSTLQNRAMEWLASDPYLITYSTEKIIQRWVLALLYYQTIGDAWTTSTNWMSDIDECQWYTTASETSICTSDGSLAVLHLEGNNLGGQLPAELSLLSNSLVRLFLRENSIGGTIPLEFESLTKLKFMQLTLNEIEGSIPTQVGKMEQLKVLGLGRNAFVGNLPVELAMLKELSTLGLEGNKLVGSIPSEWGSMTDLRRVFLSGNKLTGTIPASLGQWSLLEVLSIRKNGFTGTLPEEICILTATNLQSVTIDCEVECSCCNSCHGRLLRTST